MATMTIYEKRRVQIWLTQVRKKGSSEFWSTTGPGYYSDRHLAVIARKEAEAMWPDQFEYRTVKYLPENK